MVYYKGDLKQFSTELLTNKKGNGQVVNLAEIDEAIVKEMEKNNVRLQAMAVVAMQNTVFKYANHPKAKKGAVVPVGDYDLIEKALKQPLHIYQDTAQKDLVYVYTYPYDKGRLVKVVVHPNFKVNGKLTINNAKSWGIVDESKMNAPQYKLIK